MFRKNRFNISVESTPALAIDRLLDNDQVNKASPMGLTSKILAQSEKLQEQAEEAAAKAAADPIENEDISSTDEYIDDESEDEEGDDFGMDFEDPFDDEDFDEEEEDPEEEPEEEEPEEEKKEDYEEVSTESYKAIPYGNKKKWDIFKGLKKVERRRIKTLSSFGFGLESSESQEIKQGQVPVAYTKEPILKSLTMLGELNRKYINNTGSFIEKISVSLPKLNERLHNFERVKDDGSLIFTNELVTDIEILRSVACNGDIDLRDSLRKMRKFTNDANNVAKILTATPDVDMRDAFTSRHFLDKGELVEYFLTLPGFIYVKANIPDYINYLKSDVIDYQYYSSVDRNPTELYGLKPLSISDEKDVVYYIESLKSLVVEMGVSIDILTSISKNFSDFMNELKVIRVGVEDDEFEKLSDLGLDQKVKDFIVFKLVVDIITNNINLGFDFITGMISVMEKSIRFKSEDELSKDKEELEEEENTPTEEQAVTETEETDVQSTEEKEIDY